MIVEGHKSPGTSGCLFGLFLSALLLSGCERPVESVGLENVRSNPDAYSGKTIEIEGVAVVKFERYFICPNERAVDSRGVECVWFSANYDIEGLDHIALLRFDKKLVRVVGIFSTKSTGHLGAYVGEITPLKVDIIGTHSAGDIPKIEQHRGES